jgi:Dinucleotide-utilizing enzymes involved in molybdopterin and thiamine biosynthesis family 1
MDESFERTSSLLGAEAIRKLQMAHVAVVGIGGVGSWCAEALWRTGVGSLTLMDFDVVVPSNLNRQNEALISTLGRPKTEALADRLRDISPDRELRLLPIRCDIEGRKRLFESPCDYIADCIDSVSDKAALIREALDRGIPIISAMGTGGKTDASQLRIGDLSKTNTCPLARAVRRELRALGVTHLPVVWSPEEPKPGTPKPGTVMWVPSSAGLLMAQKIVLELISPK